MFTGIVQAIVEVTSVSREEGLTKYSLSLPSSLAQNLSIGASISVHGICQTVVAIQHQANQNKEVFFDAMAETLHRTTLNRVSMGDWVNIERSAKIGDEIGGHLLSGHIIGRATIQNKITSSQQCVLQIACDPDWMKYILPKGYIALNGASLTVVETDLRGYFTVHLIPETLRATTFGRMLEGDEVNLEIDSQTQAIVETVERISGRGRPLCRPD